MDTKEWLNRGRMQNQQVNALIDERQRIFDMATGTTCHTSDINVQRSPGNFIENCMVSYADYSKRIDDCIDNLIKIKQEIFDTINLVSDPTLRTLLLLRYINFLPWERIAESLHMSTYWVRTNVHGRALAEIEKIRGG